MPEPSVKPDSISFKELMNDIESGILKIPEFQRDFDWDLERTLRLLDSIAKRYPIGAFLLWDTSEALGSLRNVGNLPLPDVPEGKDVSYVLDGQQRITSLYAAAKGATVKGQDYDVYVDLDADPAADELFCTRCDNGRFIGLSEIIGEDAHLVTPRLTTNRQRRFHELREAFREYRFPVIRVRHQPINAVCEMFERVNTGGMELDVFDIMVAKTWTPQFNLRDRWDDVIAELNGSGYSDIDARTMLHLLGVHLRGSLREKDILKINRAEIIEAWPRAIQCLRHVVDYLRASRVAGLRLLSYPFVLVVLGHFYDSNGLKAPDRDQNDRLQQYLWRCGFAERYGSNPSSMVPEDLRLMEAIKEGDPMEVQVKHPVTANDIAGTPMRTSSAYCRTVLALLANQKPVSLKNGQPVAVDNSGLARANSRHFHHIFPAAYLKKQDYLHDSIQSVANFMLVPQHDNLSYGSKAPSSYLPPLATKAGGKWRGWLQTHLISAKAERALMDNDYERFIEARAATIAAKANAAMTLTKDQISKLLADAEADH